MSGLRTQGFWSQLKERKVIRVAVAYVLVGWVLMQIGEVTFEGLGVPPWALKLFERAAKVRPEDFQSVLLQAQLYISLDRHDKAMEVTRKGIERVRAVLELNPDDNRALNMGAFALLRLGKTDEAKKWMLTSMRNAPMDSIIQYNGAYFFSLAGEVELALDCLENCLIKVGNISREWLIHDSDMDNIRNDPRYEVIISRFPE